MPDTCFHSLSANHRRDALDLYATPDIRAHHLSPWPMEERTLEAIGGMAALELYDS